MSLFLLSTYASWLEQWSLQFVFGAQKGICVTILSCVMHKTCHLTFCAQMLARGRCTYSNSQILCPCRPVWWLSLRSSPHHQMFSACQTCPSHLCIMILFPFTQARYDKSQRQAMSGSLTPSFIVTMAPIRQCCSVKLLLSHPKTYSMIAAA